MSEKVEGINPYGTDGEKPAQVRAMFNSIARRYDIMNAIMSGGMYRLWRDRAVSAVAATAPQRILDIATGTGDVAIAMAKAMPAADITGIDLSAGMVDVGNAKVAAAGLSDRVHLGTGDALALPFADSTFDAVTVAYGVRNFSDLRAGYAEMLRVLRPGGLLAVIELTEPSMALWTPPYWLYTRLAIPAIGGVITGDTAAYRYLPRSIHAVPARADMCALMAGTGFADTSFRAMEFGVCTLYTARKPL